MFGLCGKHFIDWALCAFLKIVKLYMILQISHKVSEKPNIYHRHHVCYLFYKKNQALNIKLFQQVFIIFTLIRVT